MTSLATTLIHVPAPLPEYVPTDEDCLAWWERHLMFDNIRAHSARVAAVATTLAELAVDTDAATGQDPQRFVQSVRAAALLHDLGKTYTIRHGGNHSQIGAAWIMELSGNPRIAQGAMHHFYWPGELDVVRHFLPLVVLYADKRVRHDELVSVDERFDDLVVRYGKNEHSQAWIARARTQTLTIEDLFTTLLGVNLHEHTFDRRRLVR